MKCKCICFFLLSIAIRTKPSETPDPQPIRGFTARFLASLSSRQKIFVAKIMLMR